MKPLVPLVCCVLLGVGCASPQTYRPNSAAPGGVSGPSLPDTTPQLGPPAQGVPSTGSSYRKPASGPRLGYPEASRLNGASPWDDGVDARPISRTTQYRPGSTVAAQASSRTAKPVAIAWDRTNRSADGRVIETLRLGTGSARIAILGSLHGDETQSAALVEGLARYLQEHPASLRDATVLLVRNPNPDGTAAKSAYDRQGVDLNRNFPAANWKNLPNGRAGTRAGSQVETQNVVELLNDFRPDLVVHVKDRPLKDSVAGALINVEGATPDRAARLAKPFVCRMVEGLGAKTTGSVENYTDATLHGTALTVLLPRESNSEAAWSKYGDAFVTLVNSTGSGGIAQASPNERRLPDQPPLKRSSLEKSSNDPEFSSRSLPGSRDKRKYSLDDFPAPIPDVGYVELSAP